MTLLHQARAGGPPLHDALFSPPGTRTLAITFDDAFHSVREYAYPVLASRSWPATVFVPTSFAGAGRR